MLETRNSFGSKTVQKEFRVSCFALFLCTRSYYILQQSHEAISNIVYPHELFLLLAGEGAN